MSFVVKRNAKRNCCLRTSGVFVRIVQCAKVMNIVIFVLGLCSMSNQLTDNVCVIYHE